MRNVRENFLAARKIHAIVNRAESIVFFSNSTQNWLSNTKIFPPEVEISNGVKHQRAILFRLVRRSTVSETQLRTQTHTSPPLARNGGGLFACVTRHSAAASLQNHSASLNLSLSPRGPRALNWTWEKVSPRCRCHRGGCPPFSLRGGKCPTTKEIRPKMTHPIPQIPTCNLPSGHLVWHIWTCFLD